jgi:hypothetical protein
MSILHDIPDGDPEWFNFKQSMMLDGDLKLSVLETKGAEKAAILKESKGRIDIAANLARVDKKSDNAKALGASAKSDGANALAASAANKQDHENLKNHVRQKETQAQKRAREQAAAEDDGADANYGGRDPKKHRGNGTEKEDTGNKERCSICHKKGCYKAICESDKTRELGVGKFATSNGNGSGKGKKGKGKKGKK